MAMKEVYKKIDIFNEEYGVFISSSNINSTSSRITLFGDDLDIIAHHTVVEIIGYSEDGIIRMNGRVTLSTSAQLNMDIIESEGKKERRNFLKVKTKFKIIILRAYSLGKSNKSLMINDSIVTRDLSLGGICFYSNKTFFTNQRLLIDFHHLRSNFIAEALVLRKVHEKHKDGFRYKYGCKFINLDNEQQRVLCEYVFRVQIENHRRLMGADLD